MKSANSGNHLSRRNFLAGLGLGALTAGLMPSALWAQEKKPMNVLFISVDDLNTCLGGFGHKIVKTPNMDRIMKRGVRFQRAFSQWSSCAPSRMSFLSGLRNDCIKVFDFSTKLRDHVPNVVSLPEHFKSNGYFTARVDKIYHIGKDDPQSWTVTEEGFKDENGKSKVVWTPNEAKEKGYEKFYTESGRLEKISGEGGPWAMIGDGFAEEKLVDSTTSVRIQELMAEAVGKKMPFFAAAGFRRPHLSWHVPKKYFDMYPVDKIELPYIPEGEKRPEEKQWREALRGYYASVSYVDDKVGMLLDKLDELKIADNTVVVLFGDNGYMLGEKANHFGKGQMWDGALHVPLIFAVPGMANQGAACDHAVELLDMYPTLVDLCGLGQPATGLQGRSLTPLLENPKRDWDAMALSMNGAMDKTKLYSIRDNRYRYNEDSTGKSVNLFDYEKDPTEHRDFVNDESYKEVRERLGKIIREKAAESAAHFAKITK
jgi:uncharacterized sulfatase